MNKTIRQLPATLFIAGAVILGINGAIFFHSSWPPPNWKRVTFTLGDFGEQLVFCAAIFAAIGLLYYALLRLTRLEMKPLLGYIHFALSSAAILIGVFLDYWFSITYKKPPGGGFWATAIGGAFAALQGEVWAFWVFTAAQVVFLFSLAYALVRRFRNT